MNTFIQLGDLFINPDHIIYVDFTDEHSCMLVFQSMDKESDRVPEEIQFSKEKPEYWALKTWLAKHSEVLTPQK